MDTFDLNWPQTTATFCTNGWRCRIVWRGKKGGMGGTIENNDQCKRRVADSLEGAPELLEELRTAGYMDLAEEIQTLAPLPSPQKPSPQKPSPQPRASRTDVPAKSKKVSAPTPAELIHSWASALSGGADWEACSNRRAKSWLEVAKVDVIAGAETWCEDVRLKAPAAKGKQEWVLKCVSESAPKGDPRATPRYYAAESFHGICACIASREEYRSMEFVDAFVAGVGKLVKKHPEVGEATGAWAGQKALLEKPQSVH